LRANLYLNRKNALKRTYRVVDHNWIILDWTGWTGLDWGRLDLDWTGLNCTGLDWGMGHNWIILNWTGPIIMYSASFGTVGTYTAESINKVHTVHLSNLQHHFSFVANVLAPDKLFITHEGGGKGGGPFTRPCSNRARSYRHRHFLIRLPSNDRKTPVSLIFPLSIKISK